jgi:hypothetical protein
MVQNYVNNFSHIKIMTMRIETQELAPQFFNNIFLSLNMLI